MTGAEKSEIKDYQALKKRNMVVLALLGIILMMAMLFSLRAGSSDLSMGDIVKAIGGQSTKQNNMVMWNIRLPRILTAVLSGVGLGVTGAVLQEILKNPLADTTTLGISQGAGFGAAFAIIVLGAGVQGSSAANMSFNNPYLITICAFGGSISASVMILVLSRFRRITPEAMVLCGVALSAMFTGATTLLQYFADDVQLASVVFWTFGDLGRTGWKEVRIIAVVVVITLVYFLFNRWHYNAMESGEQTAASLGVNVARSRIINMLVCALTAAVIVSFIGIINFIGLVAPHIMRRFLGNNYCWLLPASAMAGAVLLLLGDVLARVIIAPVILPIGAITSFLGAPLFLYLLFKGGTKQ